MCFSIDLCFNALYIYMYVLLTVYCVAHLLTPIGINWLYIATADLH